jgi:hypothetical protein
LRSPAEAPEAIDGLAICICRKKHRRNALNGDQLVTLATFQTPNEAGFIRNLLAAEGIHAYLADETTIGMMWYLNTAIGGIKLQIAEADIVRANEILEAHRRIVEDLSDEDLAAEALSTPSDDDTEGEVGDRLPAVGPDDEVLDPTDDLARRALRASAIGMVCLPVSVYRAWLIGRLICSKFELSDKASWHLWLAFGMTIATIMAWWVIVRGGL